VRLASLLFLAAMACAQTTTKNWAPPKTSWGDPDLDGTWTSDDQYGVPFERPAKFGTRKTLTEQELADRIKEDELLQTSIEAGERPNAGYWKNQKRSGCSGGAGQLVGIRTQGIAPNLACGGSAGWPHSAD
jgi:hypothetical protein